jgi:hypothetical protein
LAETASPPPARSASSGDEDHGSAGLYADPALSVTIKPFIHRNFGTGEEAKTVVEDKVFEIETELAEIEAEEKMPVVVIEEEEQDQT